jgi:hypothetical protein
MPGCLTRCTDYRTDSIANAWTDIREHFGPRVPVGSEIYQIDITEWIEWALDNSTNTSDVQKFGRWLIWRCSNGTVNYGNLPSRKRDHTGKCFAPCPFDSSNYDSIRSEAMLGYTPISLSDHNNQYLKVEYHGRWGFECTYSGCPYLIEHGRPYFHV